MVKSDPYAMVRNRDEFSLSEAARIVCDVPTARVYEGRRQEWSQEMRDEKARVDEALRELKADASAYGVPVRHHPEVVKRAFNSITREDYVQGTIPARIEYGPITRDSLQAWCEARGLRPMFFHPESVDGAGLPAPVSVAECNANRAIAVMAWLLAKRVKDFKHGDKPNVSRIGEAVSTAAQELYGEDVRGLESFRKRLAAALKEFPEG